MAFGKKKCEQENSKTGMRQSKSVKDEKNVLQNASIVNEMNQDLSANCETVKKQKKSVKNEIGTKLNEYGEKYDEMKQKSARRYGLVVSIFNLLITAIFIFLTVTSLKKMQPGSVMFYFTLCVIVVYIIMLNVTMIVMLLRRRQAGEAIRQMSVAAKTINSTRGIMTKIVAIMNIGVSIMFTIENFDGSPFERYFSLATLIFSLILAAFAVIKKIKKVKKTIKKEQKRKAKMAKKAEKKKGKRNILKKVSAKLIEDESRAEGDLADKK